MSKPLRLLKNVLKSIFVMANEVYFSVFISKVECNICHFKANKLASDYWHQYTHCLKCGSEVRQRLLFAMFQQLKDFSYQKMIDGKGVLHFAPEEVGANIIKERAGNYKSADFYTESYEYSHIDFNLDISNMPEILKESHDCIIACDVLEHVPSHLDAKQEVYRILRKGGHCIFTVPQRDKLKTTYEDSTITSKADREKAFGQFDHLRMYGDDFNLFLEQTGFKVTAIDETFFTKDIIDRNVLFPPIMSKRENATNFRKVFVGAK